MRHVLALLAVLTFALSTPAHAVDSLILDTIDRLFGGEPGVQDVRQLRRLAADGDAHAQFLLYESYRTAPRGGLGPRESSDTVASRAEAEQGLRKAAVQGEPEAVFWLGAALHRGGTLRANQVEARRWLEKAIDVAPAEAKPYAEMYLAEILLFSEDTTSTDKARGLALLDSALEAGALPAIRAKARAMREGIGVEADPDAARKVLEEAVAAGNGAANGPLGDMLVRGEGGEADLKRGVIVLEDAQARFDGLAGAILGQLYLEGEHIGPHPRKTIELMAPYASEDFDTRQKLAGLLVDYRVPLANADDLQFRLETDEDAGAPGAAWTLLRLLQSGNPEFGGIELVLDVIDRNKTSDDNVALAHAAYLAEWSAGGQSPELFARMAREIIDPLADGGMAAAWTLKGKLQRKGWAYPQDDVAATESFIRAAELGDPAGMKELSDAYDEGLGVPEDNAASLKWLRQAAALGSVDARRLLVFAFNFDSFERRMTLREGITEVVALYGDQLGNIYANEFGTLFSGTRLDDFDREEIIQAFMDGFRAAPAALEEDTLVTLMQHVPQDVKADVEAVLKAEGFYGGDTEGYFRPEARTALIAWTRAAGPLPPYEAPGEEAPLAGPALPDIPADVVEAALRTAFARADAAQSDDDWKEVLPMLASLARFGDPSSRWALLRWYQQSDLVHDVVTPEELTRYGIDLLILKHPEMEKLEIEFLFTMTMLYDAHEGQAFADGFLTVLRDDPRLRDKTTLDDILNQLIFLPGGCDMLLDGAKARGVEGLPESECSNRETRDALLAYAEAAGPSGVEEAARAAAVSEIYVIAGATPP